MVYTYLKWQRQTEPIVKDSEMIKRGSIFNFSGEMFRSDIDYKIVGIRKAERVSTPIKSYKNNDSSIKAVYYVEVLPSGKEGRYESSKLLDIFEDFVDRGAVIFH